MAARFALGIGEAPLFPGGARVVRDWFDIRSRGFATGLCQSASSLGNFIALPLLTFLMLRMSWRWMFISVGTFGVGLSVIWWMLYRDPSEVSLTAEEIAHLTEGDEKSSGPPSLKQWSSLFAHRTTWGMIAGFFGTIGGDKLIMGTIDMHVIALDIKTGKKVWDVVTDNYKSERTYNSGPLVVKDKVLIGAGNCGPGSANSDPKVGLYSPPGGCFITGHDLATGKELWRFNTTAHHDDPGGNTWNNLPDDKRDGGAIWVAGQYDPELNLT